MAKKKDPFKAETGLLLCHCRTRKHIGKQELFEGSKCFCRPYNTKPSKGKNYKTVIIN